ncbi:hypothetical protein JAAARDRAFT_192070 [Jaapia argillacea MUCL 33604]|uniref:Shr3 amino acid permease chaperone n=1 Tax=Jaapia argillacea MUCL 33604 TaxID=933084 RepID=A0A067PXZ1_9AGAM|nr:hypothetical protein JAAARDRAFT_192070 [Jaapia argillacea MUCL 33604]
MGLRVCVVICVTSFLLGILFTHWIADSLTLWKSPVTDDHLWTSALYYSIISRAASLHNSLFLLVPLSAIVALGGVTILWSFRDGEAENLMFDGGSIFLYGTAVAVYLYSVIPTIQNHFPIPSSLLSTPTFPPSLRTPTLDLASSNLIASVALTGVLVFQAGRWWAEHKDGESGDEGYDGPVFDKPENDDERVGREEVKDGN